jgi:hypothetical protein
LDQRGEGTAMLISLVLVVLLLIGVSGFAFWAFSGRQDYKDNVDAKIQDATAAAVKAEDAKKAAEYAEASKYPLKTYSSPSAYGSLQVQYPKTWSAYVVEQSDSSDKPVDGYFQPNFVPSVQNNDNAYALRVQVSSQSYATVMQTYQFLIKQGKAHATPFAFPKVPNVVGTRIDGQISVSKQGSVIVVPLRANALIISTEANQYMGDFNTNILPNLTFSP